MPHVPPWWLHVARCCSTTAVARRPPSRRTSSSPAAPCRPQCRRPQAHSTQPSPGWRVGAAARRRVRGRAQPTISQMAVPALTLDPTPAVRRRDGAGAVRDERLLHLHRLEHDDEVALGDLRALGDRDLDDRALHGRGERGAARRATCAPRAGRGDAPRDRPSRGCRRPDGPARARRAGRPRGACRRPRRRPARARSAPRPARRAVPARTRRGRRRVSANSVSIQRVCTVNGSSGSAGANASASSTARWNGTTVGMPTTSSSASARRARSRACGRSAPVTMTLAIIESNSAGDAVALDDAGVDAHAGARRGSAAW